MYKLVLATVAAAAVVISPALAADMRAPVRKAPMMAPPPAFSWSGCYLGVQGGYQWGRDHDTSYITATGVANGFNQSFDSDGFVFGGHVGCNFQTGLWVFGIEGDFEGVGVDGGYRLPNLDGTDFDMKWQGSVRGRLGVAFDRTLFYATGGVAFGELEYTYVAANAVFERFRETQTGWTVGFGIEHAFAPNWTARIEYRYTEYDSISNASLVAFPGITSRHGPEFHTVRGGISFKF